MINVKSGDKTRHPEFARRLNQACESNPLVPPQNHGRLQWITDQLEKRFNVKVTPESVRKWLYGETLPRQAAMSGFAAIVGQDEAWLSLGTMAKLPKKAAVLRDARADGAVNLVAGLARMNGAAPAFPRKDDTFDARHAVDLHLIIQGAHYLCHIATFDRDGEPWRGFVPTESVNEGVVILAVCHVENLHYRIFKLRSTDFDDMRPTGGSYEITISSDGSYPEISSFEESV